MSYSEICAALCARCGGVNIGAWGEEQAFAALQNSLHNTGGEVEVTYRGTEACMQVLIFQPGAEYAPFNALENKIKIVVYADISLQTQAEEAAANCGCGAVRCDFYGGGQQEMCALLNALLMAFPVKRIDVEIPGWTQVMPQDNSAITELLALVTERTAEITKMGDLAVLDGIFTGAKYWGESVQTQADYGSGTVKIIAAAREGIFFEMLSEIACEKIDGEYSLMRYVRSVAEASRGYSKVKDALECASVNGYGIVCPSEEDIAYDSPAVIRQGGNVGIKLKASAPSYHIIRVDVSGEVNPIMGSAAQSENMVQGMMSGFERNAEEMWNTDLFGKSLKSMVQEGLSAKVSAITEDTRGKLRRAVSRMVNEGKGGAIVIIL